MAKIKVTKHFTVGKGGSDMGLWFPTIKAAFDAGKQSECTHVYRVWTVVKDSIVMPSEKEVVCAFGETVCSVKDADNILRERIAKLYNTDDITIEKSDRL